MKSAVQLRAAKLEDIPSMHHIRLSVRENALIDRSAVTEGSYVSYVEAGSAWVALSGQQVLGFAAVDAAANSVWALFIDPRAEGLGAGKALHGRILEWSRGQGLQSLRLTTSPGTRAEQFYRRQGWRMTGANAEGELCFEQLL